MEANSDGPGTSFQSFSPRRSSYEVTDVHQMEEDRWIKDAAEELKRRALRNDFAALVIVAPPRSLGVLKKYLHKEVERRIVVTVNKEMSARPIPDIETLLGNAMQTELPDV
jgi:protein required for attachment to host cells